MSQVFTKISRKNIPSSSRPSFRTLTNTSDCPPLLRKGRKSPKDTICLSRIPRFQSRTREVRLLQRLSWMKTPNPKNRIREPETAILMKKIRKSLSQKWMGRPLRWKVKKINNKNAMLFLVNQPFLGWNRRFFILKFKEICLWEVYSKMRNKTRNYLMNRKSKRKEMIPWLLGLKTSPNTVSLPKSLCKKQGVLALKRKKMEIGWFQKLS